MKTFAHMSLAMGMFLIALSFGVARAQDGSDQPTELLGGQTTIYNTTPNAFGQPVPGLNDMDELLFFVGNSFFNQNWVSAPSSTTARDGLGPYFNSRSCAGCHFKDGRGRPPAFDGESPTGFLIRLSIPQRDEFGSYLPDPIYGGQFQDRSVFGDGTGEGDVTVRYVEIPGEFPDGTPYSLRQPIYSFENLQFGEMSPDVMMSPRVANQVIGLGLLEAIPESTLLVLADPDDLNGDGISGRPNYVWDYTTNETVIGRFGWKANQPTMLQQTAGAFSGDMGITTYVFPALNCPTGDEACRSAINGGEPEIDDDDLWKVVLYSSTLAVPAQRNADDPTVQQGYTLFDEIGCTSCHVATLQTGEHPYYDALSYQTIHPYTDLLLHDMGEGLADNRPDFEASGTEWRTPPLWGIGLFETVNGHTYYLHDGRARNLTEAILWHGGEAEPVITRFMNLTVDERAAIIAFLKSL